MPRRLQPHLDDMMAWRARAAVPLTLLAFLWLLRVVLARMDLYGPTVGFLLGAGTLLTALPGLLCLPIALWTIYRAGQEAFGVRAGLGYLALAVLLAGLPGILIVPEMIRSDVERLLGGPKEDGKK
jgi:hypothetical protein